MFNLSNKNRRNNTRKKTSTNKKKNIESKPQYEEDFNDIILNDLVPEENRSEFGLDEEKPVKKNSGINLGLKKKPSKKSSKSDSSKKGEKTSDSKGKTKSSNKKTSSNSKKGPKQKDISSEDKNVNKPISKNEETKSTKKSHSSEKHHTNNKKRRAKHLNDESIEIKEDDIRVTENNESNNDDGVSFRSSVPETPDKIEIEEKTEKKMSNLVWSEDKFPKK